jgi:hypothetical protein
METRGNGDVQGSSNFTPAPVQPSSAPSQAPAENRERTFTQSEVNDLVGRAKNEAVERHRRETAMSSHQTYQQPQSHQPNPQGGYQAPQQQPQQPQYQGMSEQEFRRIAAEEANRSRSEQNEEARRQSEEHHAQRIANEFFTKVSAGDGGVQAFDTLVADAGVDLRTIPYHVQLANMCENTREVMVELLKSPSKIGQLQGLIDIDLRAGRQPRLALAEMKKLSESIKTNGEATNFKAPNEPLSQMRPSNAGTGKQGALSVSDYRKKYIV